MTIVLLTRPKGENESLAALLGGEEADILIRPLIELSAIKVTPEEKQRVMNIDQQDVVIFVSKSSVRYALPLLENYWPQWPLALRWLAVGPGTAEALAGFGIQAAYPRIAGSQGLLELPALRAVSGGKVLIVRGVGGRELGSDHRGQFALDLSGDEVCRAAVEKVSGRADRQYRLGARLCRGRRSSLCAGQGGGSELDTRFGGGAGGG